MGVAIDIANLYEVDENTDFSYLVLSCQRPEYPNHDGIAEAKSLKAIEDKFQVELKAVSKELSLKSVNYLAKWPDCYPEGDQFYQGKYSGLETIWISQANYKDDVYFVFSECDSEDEFWELIRDLHDGGELYLFQEFERPARKVKAWYAQR